MSWHAPRMHVARAARQHFAPCNTQRGVSTCDASARDQSSRTVNALALWRRHEQRGEHASSAAPRRGRGASQQRRAVRLDEQANQRLDEQPDVGHVRPPGGAPRRAPPGVEGSPAGALPAGARAPRPPAELPVEQGGPPPLPRASQRRSLRGALVEREPNPLRGKPQRRAEQRIAPLAEQGRGGL